MTKLEFEGSLGVRGYCFPAMMVVASRHRPLPCKRSARIIAYTAGKENDSRQKTNLEKSLVRNNGKAHPTRRVCRQAILIKTTHANVRAAICFRQNLVGRRSCKGLQRFVGRPIGTVYFLLEIAILVKPSTPIATAPAVE